MKNKWIFLLWFISLSATLSAQSAYRHKSEAEIAKMTPEQRVEEACKEHTHHLTRIPDDQMTMIGRFLDQDGMKVLVPATKIIKELDPTIPRQSSEEKYRKFEAAAWIILGVDSSHRRIRTTDEGRQAILVIKQVSENLRTMLYKKETGKEGNLPYYYAEAGSCLKELEGVNRTDGIIQTTLERKYKIKLSEKELAAFSEFLVSQDPTYPAWSEGECIMEPLSNPISRRMQCILVFKKPEPFFQSYQLYQQQHSPK